MVGRRLPGSLAWLVPALLLLLPACNAIDFDLPERADGVAKLCAWWRTHGAKARMGLGFYTPTAIHIDTSGFRTWGNDRTRRSSLCVTPR